MRTAPETDQLLLGCLEALCWYLFPNGRIEKRGGVLIFVVADLSGRAGHSFQIVLTGRKKGCFKQFNPGEDGGIYGRSPLDLVAHAHHGGRVGPAMAEIIPWLGLDDGAVASVSPRKAPAEPQLPATAILPIPDDAPPLVTKHHRLGIPDQVFTYYDAADRPCFHFARWDATPSRPKEIRPLTLHRRADRLVWEWQAPPAPWMLYRLNDICANPARPVLLVEGEGVADAVACFGLELSPATWCGGAGGVNQADLAPLQGRDVVCWPDADGAGQTAMVAIAKRLWLEHGTIARLVQLPSGLRRGWDLADLWPAGWTLETVERLIAEARPLTFNLSNGRTAACRTGKEPARKP